MAAPAALKTEVTLWQGIPKHGFLSSLFHSAQCYASLCSSAMIAICNVSGNARFTFISLETGAEVRNDNLTKQWYVHLFLKECHFSVFL